MRRRPDKDQYFMDMARVVAQRSHDEQTQVGCVIVAPNGRVLSTGYNGFPPDMDDGALPASGHAKYPFMVHAEANAIVSARQSLEGATLYCTLIPCIECLKLILTAGIRKVVYSEYREPSMEWLTLETMARDREICFIDCLVEG